MLSSTVASLISSCLLLLAPVLSSPLQSRQSVPDTYYLQTSSNDSSKDGLYVFSYHTGAGLSDVVLTTNVSIASAGYLNGTYQSFDLGTSPFSWDMTLDSDANYAAWEFVRINVGTGSDGFFVNDTGLQFDAEYGFAGWLVCDWYHGAPQLFWKYYYYNYTLPCSCAEVNLEIVAA